MAEVPPAINPISEDRLTFVEMQLPATEALPLFGPDKKMKGGADAQRRPHGAIVPGGHNDYDRL